MRFYSIRPAWLLLLLFGGIPLRAETVIVPHFEDVTEEAGIQFVHINGDYQEKRYLFEAKGGGIAFFDFDNDGRLDLLLVQGSTVERMREGKDPVLARLFRQTGEGRFQEVTERAGITARGWGMGVACGDYDNDGDVDLYLTGLRENVLYRNRGDGTFEDVSKEAGVADPRWTASAAFGDYDSDGDLDLYLANYVELDFSRLEEPGSAPYCQYRGRPDMCGPMGLTAAANRLYRNQGDGSFKDVTVEAGLDEGNLYYSLGAVWTDIDADSDLDLLVSNDSTPNNLYINDGSGHFSDFGFLSGLATNADGGFQASMGIDVADYDNDGRLDVFMTHFANDYSTLYHNEGGLLFEDVTSKAGLLQPEWLLVSWSTRFADFNQDGWKDLFHTNGHVYPFLIEADWSERYEQSSSLYLNGRDGTFREVSRAAGKALMEPGVGRGAAFGDYDNDGDLDIAVTRLNGTPQLLRNDLTSGGNWLSLRLAGDRSNRDGLGARITLDSGGVRQLWEVRRSVGIYSSSDARAHFGLGAADRVDSLVIHWPNGREQRFTGLEANRHYRLEEGKEIEADPRISSP